MDEIPQNCSVKRGEGASTVFSHVNKLGGSKSPPATQAVPLGAKPSKFKAFNASLHLNQLQRVILQVTQVCTEGFQGDKQPLKMVYGFQSARTSVPAEQMQQFYMNGETVLKYSVGFDTDSSSIYVKTVTLTTVSTGHRTKTKGQNLHSAMFSWRVFFGGGWLWFGWLVIFLAGVVFGFALCFFY